MRVPAGTFDIVILAPEPAIVPGLIVQFPDGKPVNSTLPVATAQVGCIIVPVNGAEGVTGCEFITTFVDASDVHPTELVTV